VSIETLEDFAEMIGIELVVVDQDTTVKTFKKELQWNQAYHHLAGAF
jgi:L-arabinose isomerase